MSEHNKPFWAREETEGKPNWAKEYAEAYKDKVELLKDKYDINTKINTAKKFGFKMAKEVAASVVSSIILRKVL